VVNKVIIVGNLGRDPEVRFTPSGRAMCKFSVATTEKWTDQQGQKQERTEWHNVIAWQRLAEIVGEYVKKGNRIYIEGKLQTSSWDDKESGQKKYRTEIIANDLVLLGGRGESEDSNGGSRGSSSKATGNFDQRSKSEDNFSQPAEITDDDIPF